jgi:hypothetical protein
MPAVHDVALSFARPQRNYAREVARRLRAWGVDVFFDEDFEIELWGENLQEYLQRVYQQDARFVVMFISEDYVLRPFPTHERRSAFFGQLMQQTRVLPLRFDDTEVPGLDAAVSYLWAPDRAPGEMADAIAGKLQRTGVRVFEPLPSSARLVPRAAEAGTVTVTVLSADGDAIEDAMVGFALPGGQVLRAAPVGRIPGKYTCQVPAGRRLRLWVAHSEHPPFLGDTTSDEDVVVEIGAAAGVRSILFFGSTGHLPSVSGRFNPIVDGQGRTYLYVDNACIAHQVGQPFHFETDKPFEVEDSDGSVTVVTIRDIRLGGSLIEYEPP